MAGGFAGNSKNDANPSQVFQGKMVLGFRGTDEQVIFRDLQLLGQGLPILRSSASMLEERYQAQRAIALAAAFG